MMKKISQVELVSYVNEIDEKLKNKRYRDTLYKSFFEPAQRKTKADKKYFVISKLVEENYQAKVSPTTVWRILKIKNKSSKAFNSILTGSTSIKTTYNELFNIDEEKTAPQINLVAPTTANIENTLIEIKNILETNKDSFSNNDKLNNIDTKLFELRKTIHKLMQYNDQ